MTTATGEGAAGGAATKGPRPLTATRDFQHGQVEVAKNGDVRAAFAAKGLPLDDDTATHLVEIAGVAKFGKAAAE